MSQPFREPRIPPREVRRILRRASELAESDTGTGRAERTMTRTELERAAGELGLPSSSVARAIDDGDTEAREPERGPLDAPHSVFLGAPTRLVLESEVGGEPSDTDREDLIEEIRDIVGQPGSIESVGKTLSWRLGPGFRSSRDLSVRLRSRNGRTRIVIEERMSQQATGLFAGLGFGGGLGPMGGYIAAFVKLGAMAALVPILWIPMMLLLARTIYVQIARRRARTMGELMKRITQSASHWSAGAPQLRVGGAAAREAREAPVRVPAPLEAEPDEEEASEAEALATGRTRRA